MNLSTDPPAPVLKLLTDGMLGRLTRWLRALGYDTVYAPDTDDNELLRRARAQDRVLLTADHALAMRRGARTLLIETQDLARPTAPGARRARSAARRRVLTLPGLQWQAHLCGQDYAG